MRQTGISEGEVRWREGRRFSDAMTRRRIYRIVRETPDILRCVIGGRFAHIMKSVQSRPKSGRYFHILLIGNVGFPRDNASPFNEYAAYCRIDS